MRTKTVRVFLVVSCGLLFAGGCAKQEVVKKDEPIAPAATAVAKPPVKPEAAKAPVKTEAVKSEPAKQASVKESAAQAVDKSAEELKQLQAALEKIYFDFDSSKLSDKARATLTNDAGLLKKAPVAKVRIEGNCDERGSDEYNLALGERRAKAAQQYLMTMGIPANSLSVISYGKEKPADPGHDEAAWAKKRRDDFVVVTK
jgi:peptidoglycan-associated lipoprotein